MSNLHPEIKAMEEVYNALKDLQPDEQYRVIAWLNKKFVASMQTKENFSVAPSESINSSGDVSIGSFSSVADLFAASSPKTEVERTLIVAAYLTEKEGKTELSSREINEELNHLGYRVSNITAAINNLQSRKPSLMIQTRKSGKTQQAQKKVKVTIEGLKFVKSLLYKTETNS